jgi:hypothetical protein
MAKINASDTQAMVTHWLETPVNGYLGDSYGSIVPDLLQQPQRSGLADTVLNKLRADVPLVGAMPASQTNLYAVHDGPDKTRIFIEVGGDAIDLGTTT